MGNFRRGSQKFRPLCPRSKNL